jgi:hypothetical protein
MFDLFKWIPNDDNKLFQANPVVLTQKSQVLAEVARCLLELDAVRNCIDCVETIRNNHVAVFGIEVRSQMVNDSHHKLGVCWNTTSGIAPESKREVCNAYFRDCLVDINFLRI